LPFTSDYALKPIAASRPATCRVLNWKPRSPSSANDTRRYRL